MLRTLILLILLAVPAQAQIPDNSARDQIRSREEQLIAAMQARDGAGLDTILTPDYVLRGAPDVARETWIRNAVSLCWGDRSEIDRFDVQAIDGVAIATFELTFYVSPTTCQPAILRSLMTDIWVRENGTWRLRIRHAAAPPAADAGVAAQYGIVPLPPPQWDLSGELSFVSTAGNTSTRTAGLGSTLIHRTARTRSRGVVNFITSEADGVTQARALTVQGRHGIQVRPRLETFGLSAFTRDRFAGITSRLVAEGGLAYTATLPRRHVVTGEGSLGYTSEQRIDSRDLEFVNLTGRVTYSWTALTGTQVSQDSAVVADLEQASNWRTTSTTAMTVTLTRVLSLKASHLLDSRNTPVAGFRRTDMRTAVALVVSWQHRPPAR